jgi:hypothetical protein
LLYSALTVLALWISTMYLSKRPEPTSACDELLVEIINGPRPQITSPKSPASEADRENPISYRLDEVEAYRNATSLFGG